MFLFYLFIFYFSTSLEKSRNKIKCSERKVEIRAYCWPGRESFHQRNNSFREHNTLFSADKQPCSLTHTLQPMPNTTDPYDMTTELYSINNTMGLKEPKLWKELNKAWGELWPTVIIWKWPCANFYCFLRQKGETHCSDMPWLSYSKTVPLQAWLCLMEWTKG